MDLNIFDRFQIISITIVFKAQISLLWPTEASSSWILSVLDMTLAFSDGFLTI